MCQSNAYSHTYHPQTRRGLALVHEPAQARALQKSAWPYAVEVVFTLSILAAGLLFFPLRVMGTDLRNLPAMYDTRLNICFLEHGWQWLNGKTDGFWNLPAFYPYPNVTAYSDNHLGTLPLYALFRCFRLDRETAFQCWFLTLFVLNYFASYAVLRKLDMSAIGSAAGSYGFAFGLPLMSQIDHPQLYPLFPLPLTFFFACRVCERSAGRDWAGLGVFFVWQVYCGIYLGYFTGLFLAAFMPLYFARCNPATIKNSARLWSRLIQCSATTLAPIIVGWRHPCTSVGQAQKHFRMRPFRRWVCSGLGMAVLGTSLAMLFLPYVRAATEQSSRYRLELIRGLQPHWRSWLNPPPNALLWAQWSLGEGVLPNFTEQWLFLGLLPTAALLGLATILPLRYCRDYRVSSALIGAALLIVLTLTIRKFSLYECVICLPGTRAIRAVGRIALVVAFPGALALAWWLTGLQRRIGKMLGQPVAMAVAFLAVPAALADQATTGQFAEVPKAYLQARSHQIAEEARRLNPRISSLLYVAPPGQTPPPEYRGFVGAHIDGMLAAQELGVPTVNGYSGNAPPGYEPIFRRWSDVEQWKVNVLHRVGESRLRQNPTYAMHGFSNMVVVGVLAGEPGAPCTIQEGPLPAAAFRGRVDVVQTPPCWKTNSYVSAVIEISNTSLVAWPALGGSTGRRLGLGCRWRKPGDSAVFDGDRWRDHLDHDLAAGQTARLETQIPVPRTPGRYVLELDLCQERVGWFSERGSPPMQLEIEVIP